jgi:hypothetical protein
MSKIKTIRVRTGLTVQVLCRGIDVNGVFCHFKVITGSDITKDARHVPLSDLLDNDFLEAKVTVRSILDNFTNTVDDGEYEGQSIGVEIMFGQSRSGVAWANLPIFNK